MRRPSHTLSALFQPTLESQFVESAVGPPFPLRHFLRSLFGCTISSVVFSLIKVPRMFPWFWEREQPSMWLLRMDRVPWEASTSPQPLDTLPQLTRDFRQLSHLAHMVRGSRWCWLRTLRSSPG